MGCEWGAGDAAQGRYGGGAAVWHEAEKKTESGGWCVYRRLQRIPVPMVMVGGAGERER